ncbi:MAG: DUF3696 domain-containing protein [Bacteroidia bacterium]|nr:DUF3696 domain-containing protein [Bacteroidia bacterium]
MITSISLTNFKCYGETTTFPLSKINLLTGINGKGKSSFLQSLLLFRQSVEHNPNTKSLILNGSCVNLGAFKDVKNKYKPNDMPIYVKFETYDKNTDISLSFYYDFVENEKDDRNLLLGVFHLDSSKQVIMKHIDNDQSKVKWYRVERNAEGAYSDPDSKLKYFHLLCPNDIQIKPPYDDRYDLEEYFSFYHIHYVAADRLGPQEFYPKNNLDDFIHVGKKGEYIADVLYFYQKQQLIIPHLGLAFPDSEPAHNKDYRLQIQAGQWLSYILDTENVSIILNDYPVYLDIAFKMGTKTYTPPNVGFGYSYILPIIVAGLVAKENEILIIENPEAHLHPRAQSRLANFLARVASMGVQVFIESHSEHILNGIRVATLKPDIQLNNEDVSVLYFQDNEKYPFIQLPIEKDGSIKNWVDGFFDQQEIDLAELFKLNRNKK